MAGMSQSLVLLLSAVLAYLAQAAPSVPHGKDNNICTTYTSPAGIRKYHAQGLELQCLLKFKEDLS